MPQGLTIESLLLSAECGLIIALVWLFIPPFVDRQQYKACGLLSFMLLTAVGRVAYPTFTAILIHFIVVVVMVVAFKNMIKP